MQYFTFHRKADRLRGEVLVWQVAAVAELGALIAMGVVVEKPFGYYILLWAVFYFAFAWWLYSRPLRRRHRLTETTLTLVEKSGRSFDIPRDQIASVERFTQALPYGLKPITYKYVPSQDTLYILPDKRNLVAITLKSPVSARLAHRVVVEFTRVVCMVDDPEGFIAAVSPKDASSDANRTPSAFPRGSDGPMLVPQTVSNPGHEGSAAIRLTNLTKRFGDFTAVDRLTLRVAPGEIFALLGSNGAGKSTTIRMLVGLLRPTDGEVLIHGRNPWRELEARRLVGYVPDTPMLYENLTAREHLWLIGGLYDLPESAARKRASEVLEQVGLQRHADQPIRSLSLGMKRKLSIAAALMHRPPVLVLDEATNGLDPRAAREVKDLIRAAAQSGTTVLLTTHLLDVVAELANRIAIIDQGVMRACGTLPELQRAFGRPDGSLEELFLLATDRNEGASA